METINVRGALITRQQLKDQLRKSDRTIRRYEIAGLPVVILGNDRLYDPAKAFAWIMTHERQHEPVRRGRRPGQRAA